MSVSERFATAVGRLLERKVSRRSALSRAALAGSAFAVAPVRYMIRPGTAWAVLRPENCGSGLCTDGYTAFCCEIEHGNNRCPAGTYVAGWWKCTAYKGHGLCADAGVRYYIDCNRMPGTVFPGGCQCANGDCHAAVWTATTSATASATRRSPGPPRWSAGWSSASTPRRCPA